MTESSHDVYFEEDTDKICSHYASIDPIHLCILLAEIIAYKIYKDGYSFTYQVFSDGSEAYGLHAYEISDGTMTVMGSDPHFEVSSYDQTFSRIRIEFQKPLEQDTELQIYYTPVDGSVSEKNSTEKRLNQEKSGNSSMHREQPMKIFA